MVIFQTGASGYIGGAVAEALQRDGHTVRGLARDDQSAAALESRGIQVVRGGLFDSAVLRQAAQQAQAVVHTASTNGPDMEAADRTAVEAMLQGLDGTNHAFVYTQGAWDYGDTGEAIADESWPAHPLPFLSWRPEVAARVRSAAERGVRSIVIRPANVYGEGRGLLTMLTKSARELGAARYVGSGRNVWNMVHVRDLAQLYAAALARAAAGEVFNGAGEPACVLHDLADAASRGAGADGRTESWPLDAARLELGPVADAWALNQRLSGEKARDQLGWTPMGPSVLRDLESGSYTAAARR